MVGGAASPMVIVVCGALVWQARQVVFLLGIA